jgi:outer membrane receptor protein involved in Fe transport
VNHKGEHIENHGSDSQSDSYYGDFTSLDLSTAWNVTDNMRLYFDANNLNNEPLRYYKGSENRPLQVEYYGPRFQFGLS